MRILSIKSSKRILQLTHGISAQVVGPHRRTLITLDLDLYARSLKIQQFQFQIRLL